MFLCVVKSSNNRNLLLVKKCCSRKRSLAERKYGQYIKQHCAYSGLYKLYQVVECEGKFKMACTELAFFKKGAFKSIYTENETKRNFAARSI